MDTKPRNPLLQWVAPPLDGDKHFGGACLYRHNDAAPVCVTYANRAAEHHRQVVIRILFPAHYNHAMNHAAAFAKRRGVPFDVCDLPCHDGSDYALVVNVNDAAMIDRHKC